MTEAEKRINETKRAIFALMEQEDLEYNEAWDKVFPTFYPNANQLQTHVLFALIAKADGEVQEGLGADTPLEGYQ